MRVLVACEQSGVVRDAFAARGHDAFSCDLKPAPGNHLQGDVFRFLETTDQRWDLMIAHPPCRYLSSSGLHWIARGRIEDDGRPRSEHFQEALQFVRRLMAVDVERIAIENPVGAISTQIRRYDQKLHPYEFGDDASKQTCLWLRGLPALRIDPSARKAGRMVTTDAGRCVERWANQTDSGQNIEGPTKDPEKRRAKRAVTYPGIARAMAEQWG